ncbi:substrate-binding domain-containing protein [Christensenellaceae bacterium OttesenSCG-928-K19]|nr:substrate-binding domain-containing protein [Christensenellaceae bacterium OttesenSCG-928-K19]
MVVFLCGFLLPACQMVEGNLTVEDGPNGVVVDRDLNVIFITPLNNHPIWLDAKYGAEAKGRELGVTVTWSGPEIIDIEKQVEIMYDAIEQEYDAIIMYPVDPPAFEEVMRAARDAGIPVVAVCGDSDPALRDSYVGTDVVRFGQEAAELIGEKSGGQANLAILCTNYEIINQVHEYEAFEAVIKEKYPGIKIVAREADDTDTLKAIEKTIEILEEYPEVDFFWSMEGAGGPGIVRVLKERGLNEEIPVLATDSMTDMLDYIEAGDAWGSLAQNFYKLGMISVENAVNHIYGNEVEDVTDSGFVFITQENVQSFRETAEGWY